MVLEVAILSLIKIFMKKNSASGIIQFCRKSFIYMLAPTYG